MNKAQTKLLRWLDSEWTKERRRQHMDAGREARLAMYSRAVGRRVASSKDLTNDDLTKIKAHVLAQVKPDDYRVQIKILEDNDPEMIRRVLLDRCMEAARVLKPDYELTCEPRFYDDRRASWLAGWSKNLGKDYRQMDNVELRKFVGVCEDRAEKRRQKNEREAAAEAIRRGEESDANPF